jgi:hypothetical protein
LGVRRLPKFDNRQDYRCLQVFWPFWIFAIFLSRFFNAKIPILPLHNRLKNFENRGLEFLSVLIFLSAVGARRCHLARHAPKEAVAPSRDEAAQARLLDARRVLRARER